MSRIVDNLVAYRILSMLVTPFEDSKAYKLGIIDAKGKSLKKSNQLKTTEEKNNYTYLHRLVFNMKRIINKLPGGETKLRNLIAALWLVKEYYQGGKRTTSLMESRFDEVLRILDNNVVLAEEEIAVKKFMAPVEEDAPVNATGAPVSTDEPVVKKKDVKKYLAKRDVKVI
jgi:hypothetical protein